MCSVLTLRHPRGITESKSIERTHIHVDAHVYYALTYRSQFVYVCTYNVYKFNVICATGCRVRFAGRVFRNSWRAICYLLLRQLHARLLIESRCACRQSAVYMLPMLLMLRGGSPLIARIEIEPFSCHKSRTVPTTRTRNQ